MLTGERGGPHLARSHVPHVVVSIAHSREPATRALTSSLCEIQIVFANDNTYTTHAPTGATAGTTEITPSVGWPLM